ncbi:oxygen-independent coproporphyrinogen-3 oxidase [Anaerocolumna jejuensis DSM 15929]|uniref:Heme chaperone HemW n=1 Tax=Anaerocolumna jejuensis DSM 15929 TaxID=1121322 RepID=A0A1M6KYI9_9FIRM|nr:radical SAM family heme chaperone HemW [Anaerocolumna jejuensis]SHJ63959.1 oxygen-independent coproporphyrinogen-3 oxidase [Anaerocolumna jejuensis DSM 15929]
MNNKKNLGLYLHIPFCERKCLYCDFLSAAADKETKDRYVNALINEITSYKEWAQDYLVKTIFLGGGTPTSLSGENILRIMEAAGNTFFLDSDTEITIEANPGTVDREKLLAFKEAGINRISMGLQSADNRELKLLGRIHTYETFAENYCLARELKFDNINVDLMSSLPGQSLKDWMSTLKKVADLEPEHISAYSLILEEGTYFYRKYSSLPLDEELDRQMYWETEHYLKDRGYRHYEISNYARDGRECRHNNSYWIRENYLGLGLGASSLIENTRFRKEDNLEEYIRNAGDHALTDKEQEVLTVKQQMEEFMFLGLRLTRGISKAAFQQSFHVTLENIYKEELDRSIKEGLLQENGDRLCLTDKGIDLSNTVMARFLLDSEIG